MILDIPCCDVFRRHRSRHALNVFYKRQRHLQECHAEDEAILQRQDSEHAVHHQESRDKKKRWDEILSKSTLLINVVMVVAKITAAYLSHSLSIVASVVDSVMDITSGLIIWMTVRSIDNNDTHKYPIGRARLEPLAILVVSMIMMFANIMVIYEASMAIIERTLHPDVQIPTIVILCTGTVAKTLLYLLCRRQDSPSSQLLAQDQLNDIFTNTVALACAFLGHRYWIYCDPIGAYLVSTFIILNWVRTAYEQVPLLIGRTATPEFINRISRIAISHDDKIRALDTVYAYHLGSNFLVEIHVLMDGDLSLHESHDISEALQQKIERLPFVERAFVHCDYKLDGDEHLKKFN